MDFVITVFERTYREVLRPGNVRARAESFLFPFAKTVIVVNNVDDRGDLMQVAAPLLESGEVDEIHFVADRIDETLKAAGLTSAMIQETVYYTNWALVEIFLPGSRYMVHCDADVFLREPVDWVHPALKLMQEDSRIAVANPNWTNSRLKVEAREWRDGFGIGYGFTDQIYLLDRHEFARPIYRHRSPISLRYPFANIAPIFEQRVDAYMRSQRRMRATYADAVYLHDSEEGATHKRGTRFQRLKRTWMNLLVSVIRRLPGDDPRFHI